MDNGMIKRQIRELCRSPQPERKAEFFLNMKDQGLLKKPPFSFEPGRIPGGTDPYTSKKDMGALGIPPSVHRMGICRYSPGHYPFALTPLLAAGVLVETRRSLPLEDG